MPQSKKTDQSTVVFQVTETGNIRSTVKRGDIEVSEWSLAETEEAHHEYKLWRSRYPGTAKENLIKIVDGAWGTLAEYGIDVETLVVPIPDGEGCVPLPTYLERYLGKAWLDNSTLAARLVWHGTQIFDENRTKDEALEEAACFWHAFYQFHYFHKWSQRTSRRSKTKFDGVVELLFSMRSPNDTCDSLFALLGYEEDPLEIGPYKAWQSEDRQSFFVFERGRNPTDKPTSRGYRTFERKFKNLAADNTK